MRHYVTVSILIDIGVCFSLQTLTTCYSICVKELFSPKFVNWLIAIVFGAVIPIGGQAFIANIIAGLNFTPSYANGEIVPADPSGPVLWISVLFVAYVTAIAYQIRYIAMLKTHSSVFALIVTLVVPVLASVTMPILLGSFV